MRALTASATCFTPPSRTLFSAMLTCARELQSKRLLASAFAPFSVKPPLENEVDKTLMVHEPAGEGGYPFVAQMRAAEA